MHHNAILVASAKAGSYDAFEQLVCRHERRVYALAMQLVQQREDAEDVVQTTFLSALGRKSMRQPPYPDGVVASSPRAWRTRSAP
jgi:DNA-directed RNA polymerase specialized sigma24 family protein